VQSLAALNTVPDAVTQARLAATRSARAASEGAATALGGRSLATFSLQADFAVPLERLAEVLPCGEAPPAFGAASRVQRMIVRRGRTIPRFDLGELLGQPGAPVGCVLVVDGPSGPVGFAVPALQAIEPAQWERPFPASVVLPPHDPRAGASRTMAAVGASGRVVEVLDPVALAARLLAPPIG
jgi:chemotaxis signal transduction protein